MRSTRDCRRRTLPRRRPTMCCGSCRRPATAGRLAARVPGAKQSAPFRVVVKAFGSDGTALFDGSVAPTGPLSPDRENLLSRAVFDVPPGVLHLRMSIEDSAQRALDSDVRDITIRD